MNRLEKLENELHAVLKTLNPTIGSFTRESELRDLGIDSLATMDLILMIEDRFELEIPATHLAPERIRTVGTLLVLIAELGKGDQS